MKHSLANLDMLASHYKQTLLFFGINHPVGKRSFKGYDNAREFADNLKAPIEIPIVVLTNLLKAAINCLEHAVLLCINFLVFDFSHARDRGVDIINSLGVALYNLVKGFFYTIISTVELVTRSAATLVEGVAEVFSPSVKV